MRTHYNTDVGEDTIEQKIIVTGWINSIRVHGEHLYFIDLRDKSGIVQIVADPTVISNEMKALFHTLRDEWVIEVSGLVRLRGEGLENPNLITGKIEIVAEDVEVLSKAKTLPFQPGDKEVNMDIKLKYRYLEMRDVELQKTLKARSTIAHEIRNVLFDEDYTEIETPVLIKSSEGGAAEVYATSKLFPGE
ncbi:MAG: aspartate--tRNA ligase, partial [Candidatus Cloacimonadota bacterium]